MMAQDDLEEVWLDEALARFAASRDPALRDQILERTLWLATRCARRFTDRGEPLDDLVQVARIGLLKALERFDPAQGVPFGAYATPTMMGELRRHFRDHTWSLKVPRRAKDLRGAVRSAVEELTRELGRSPRVPEVATHLGVPEDAVLEALEAAAAYRASSLDPALPAHIPVAADGADAVIDRATVLALLDRLPPRERRILYLRFYEELSQSQIAEQIGTSQVHVGRLITSSLAALRSLATVATEPAESEP
jgi:RNA polymerase sigma-B factor